VRLKQSTILVLVLAMVIALALWLFATYQATHRDIENVLLISIDTCRADYLGCYGYRRRITPNIDDVARRGVLFENVITPVPITLPAHTSMLAGTTPLYHQVHDNGNYFVAPYNINLAQILAEHGFATGAIVSAAVLDSKFGLNRGFETYNDNLEQAPNAEPSVERKGGDTTEVALDWLERHADSNFFLFLHYFDPHTPYEPPTPFSLTFGNNLYAGEVAYTDHCIGRVIQKLKDLDLYDSTLLVITADHGEMLGEHSEQTHGYTIYESAIKVPLVIRLPGSTRPKRIQSIAGLIDIAPTICGLLGLDTPDAMQGRDLSADITASQTPSSERYLYCESLLPTIYGCNPLLGVVGRDWKYIQTTRPELYDLASDRKEKNNLIGTDPKTAHLMRENLDLMLDELTYKDQAQSQAVADARTIKQLESLGYIAGSGIDDSLQLDPAKPDPKDFTEFHELNVQVHAALNSRQFERAKALSVKMLEEKGDYLEALIYLARIAFRQGSNGEAIQHYSQYLDKADPNWAEPNRPDERLAELAHKYPSLPKAHADLGFLYYRQGQPQEAVEHYEASLRLVPNQTQTLNNLAVALKRLDKYEEAICRWEDALRLDPNLAEAHYNIASTLQLQGKTDEAIARYQQALELNAALKAGVFSNLGDLYRQEGDAAKAIEYWNESLELQPNSPELLNKLALLYATAEQELRRPERAVQLAERACQITRYEAPSYIATLAEAYAADGEFDRANETAARALQVAQKTGADELAADIERAIERYSEKTTSANPQE